MQVQLLPDALKQDKRPVLLTVQDAGPSSRRHGFESRTGHSERLKIMTKWWNRQTHDVQSVGPSGRGSSSLPLVTRDAVQARLAPNWLS